MLDAKDARVLDLARKTEGTAKPGWWDAKWTYVFIFGGVAFFVWDLVDRVRPSAAAGFMLGGGLGALLMHVPLTRRVWRCYRLVRQADAAGVFDGGDA